MILALARSHEVVRAPPDDQRNDIEVGRALPDDRNNDVGQSPTYFTTPAGKFVPEEGRATPDIMH